ncbi:negative regulator of systemic acquired resistance SNI1 isoform X2 [Aristolochia californica]|uniref:negative regulator of systemic acquired resistance SNI1 isoform X2 n=1 Tax=Aristolochia californica TaxID=171875 RepID=UPI0035DF48B3
MESRRRSMRGLEENTMAILDTCGVKDSRDVHDDRLSFLEAVRSASIIATDGTVPTRKMFDAIFEIFKDGMSLELTVASYRLLCDLDKHYPRVYFSQSDEIVVVQEAWSPFAFGSGNTREAINCRPSVELIDSDRFFLLTQKIAQTVSEMDPLNFGMEDIGNMFLFQYIVNVLAQDFVPLSASYRKRKNWSLLRESLLHLLLGSRKLSFKSLTKECMSIICNRVYHHAEFSADPQNQRHASVNMPVDFDIAVSIAVPELQKEVCVSVQRLLTVIMELDVIKMEADREGVTSRVDGVRTPLVELILEELMYNKDLLCPFLEASVRTRRSNNIVEAATLENVLKLFSNETKARQIVKKVNADAAQLLLSQAFHAYMSLKQGVDTSSTLDEEIGGSSIVQICRDMISAFQNLRRTTKDLEIELFQKEALFTAATILLRES